MSVRGPATRFSLQTATALLVVGGFALAYATRHSLLLFFAALVIGTALRPAVDRLSQRGIPRALTATALLAAAVAVCLAAVVGLWPIVSEQLGALALRLPSLIGSAHERLSASQSVALRQLGVWMSSMVSSTPAQAETGNALAQALALVDGLGRGCLGALLVVSTAFYWATEGESVIRNGVQRLGAERRPQVREILDEAEAKIGGYVRGQVVVCLLSAVLAVSAYSVIGVPYALVLGLTYGLLEAVPVIGPLAAALPAVLLGLSISPSRALWTSGAILAVHLVQGYVFAPRLMGRAVGVSSFVVLLSLAAFGSLLGITGALLAIPIAALLQLAIDRLLLREDKASEPHHLGRGEADLLILRAEELVQDVRRLARREVPAGAESVEAEDLAESIAGDLQRLLAGGQPPARSKA